MNARQKAKRYKKELERIRSEPFKPTIVQYHRPIITLQASYIENYDKYNLSPVLSKKAIIDHLYSRIAKDCAFKDAVSIQTEIDECTGNIKYTARLQVLG